MSERLGRLRLSTSGLIWCLCLVAAAIEVGHAADAPSAVARATVMDPTALRQCQFIEGTLVPRMVMGVRRVNDGTIDALAVRAERDPDGPVVAEVRLFRPYYVVDRRIDSRTDEWFLIQDTYASTKRIGWVAARHVEPFRSRYAYTFAPSDRDRPADLHDTSKDGYERLLAQMTGDPEAAKERVLIQERNAGAPWNPITIDDPVPFIELRLPADSIDEPKYPDTTPTHRFGISAENRLIHMGAICGGPADLERLASLRKENQMQAGLEMVFVIDETHSMQDYFGGVADFIDLAGRVAAKQGEAVKLAVSYYTDGPPGTRVTATPLAALKGEEAARQAAVEVRMHADKLPPGDYANAPERMLEGLRDAITTAGFTDGSDAFVAIVGDTGHEPADAREKAAIIEKIAELIQKHRLHVFFAHVGRRQTPSDMLFEKDAKEVRAAAKVLGVPEERVVYQTADANTLSDEIGRAQERAAQLRRERLRQIERIESRTPYTEPGPKLIEQLGAVGVSRAKFDDLHLQYYLPSRGWLFHPISPAGAADSKPQFRELVFLSAPERDALRQMFTHVQGRLAKGETIDHQAAVSTLATALAASSGNPAMEVRVQAAWKRLPQQQRSLGVFLEDVFGLRLKAALPYPSEALTKQPATAEEIRTLDDRIGQLSRAFAECGPATVWVEASRLVP
jgi:hypothetical protein